MSDFVWVLRHQTNKLAKTWKANGTISNYDDPKQFIGTEISVANIHDLSTLLSKLEPDTNACVIRGKYKGYEHSLFVEPDDTKKGRVLRRLSVHDDPTHHWVLVDIDNYEPFDYDPLLEPLESITEFVTLHLPTAFHGASFHWQLSSSSGHPSKSASKLKAHVWFWLHTPYTSAQLFAWAKATGYKGDKALLNSVQVHYTALPVFEQGVINPIRYRSGFSSGDFGDEVKLQIDESIIESAGDGSAPMSRHQKILEVWAADPVAAMLNEERMMKSKRPDGGMNIICPREEHHTGTSGESSTIYYPAHTGGYRNGTFVCLHEHCRGVPQSLFLDALGYDDAADVFQPIQEDRKRERGVPEAKHLCTDQANANRIVSAFKTRIMVVSDRWYAWDGKRWKPDDGEATIKAMNLSKIISKEADEWQGKRAKTDDEKKKNVKISEMLRAWSKKSEMGGTINAALSMAKKVLTVDADEVDSHQWLLNVGNGTVDLRTGSLKPHEPDDLITKLITRDYRPDATCPTFETVLLRVTREEGKPSAPVTRFSKRWFGYNLTGSTREQKFVVHYGNGRNGKSTILDTIADIMGDYAGTAAPGLMMSTDRGRHPTEIADLFGRRMVTAHESGEGGVLREEFIKQATGGDRLKARYMNKDFFEFSPTHKLQLLTNHKPIIKGQDEGIWRRVLLIPYAAKFGSEEEVLSGVAHYVRDTRIMELLQNESAGILTWLIEGAVEWYRDGLNPPDSVIAASKQYQGEQDRVLQFASEVCNMEPDQQCYLTNGDHSGVYPTYVSWCKLGGMHPLSKMNFLTGLERVVPHFKKEEKLITDSGRRRKVTVLHGLSSPEYFEL